MAEATVIYAAQGGVARITLNRPQSLNSFTRQMHQELWAALDQAEADPAVRALVLTGAGRGFCAGADLSEFDFAPGPDREARADPGPLIDQAFNPTARRFQALRMPTIAAVNGVAAGAGASLAMSCDIAIAAPSASFVQAFSKGLMPVLQNLADPDMLHAIWLTVMIALITVPVNLVFGTLLAWLVTRFTFPGRQLLLTLLDIPFAVSPVVAGLVYLLFYGSNGPLGGWLDAHNLQIMFAWPGMVLATIFVTCPFVVRELVPVMMSQGSHEDEAAVLLGASGWQMFRRVTLPNIRWALLYGVVLTNARAIGEFGAVSVVSGSIRGETLSLPLQIELLEQDYNTVGSFTAAALLTLMAILTLFLKSMLQWRLANQKERAQQEGNHEH